jgi:hypothetical protein
MLLARALGISKENLDSLRANWGRNAPHQLNAAGRWTAGNVMRADVEASFSLPGPAAFSFLLPDSADVDDMGSIEGTIEAAAKSGEDGWQFDASLDISRTDWIDSSIAHIRGTDRRIEVDTVGIALEGIDVGIHGSVIDSLIDIQGSVDVRDAGLARRFASGVPDLTLQGDITVSGPTSAPDINAMFDASITDDAYQIPELLSVVHVSNRRIDASIDAPQGVASPQVRLDRLTASLASLSDSGGTFPARMTLTAAGEQFDWLHSMRVDTSGGLAFDVDTLQLQIGGQDLRLRRPFCFAMPARQGGITIDNAELAGTMGKIKATGYLRPDSSDLSAMVVVTFPPKPPPIFASSHLWPERMEVDFRAWGTHNLSLHSRLEGFSLVTDQRPVLDMRINSDSVRVNTLFSISDSTGTVLDGEGRVPAALSLYPPSLSIDDDSLSLVVMLDRFPMGVRLIGGGAQVPEDEIIYLDGAVGLGGTTKSVSGDVNLNLDFTGWPKLSKYDLSVEAKLGASSMEDTSAGGSGELTGALRLEREGQLIMTADVMSPLALSLNPPKVHVSEDDNISIEVLSDSIPLEDFDPLLPLEAGLGGVLSMSISGAGLMQNPTLEGSVKSAGFEITAADQARMSGDLDIRIAGTREKPEVKGEIKIVQAFINIPDQSENLHPIEGEAILLVTDSLGAVVDTIRGEPATPEPPTQAAGEPADVDLDVNIIIPSGFWIRGKGLDLELSGDLTIKQEEGKPTVTGELRVIRGTLVALGRTLELERGVVTFYGGDEIDPSLDVVLGAVIEGTKVQILFGGTAQKPELKFASEPDMPQADIMSVLLFGRPYGQLDDGQANLMRDRTREMLVSVGASKLQSEMGGQLGIDVVSVKSTGEDNEGTALTVGKYLNPQLLLSYAYALDKDYDSFVSLEYFLKGQFKVETIFGNKGQTSIGIGWSRDY